MTDNMQSTDPEPEHDSAGEPTQQASGRARQQRSSSTASSVIVGIIILLLALTGYATATNASGTLGAFNLSSLFSQHGDDGVAAVVNGEEIPMSEFEQRVQQTEQQLQGQQGVDIEASSTQQQIRQQAINNLVDERLLDQAIAESGITVGSSSISARLDQLRQQSGGQEQFQQQLQQRDITIDQLRDNIRRQLEVEQYVTQEATSTALSVSDQEVRQLYDQLSSQATGTQQLPSFEEAQSQLRTRLEQQRQRQALQNLINQLRSNAEIDVRI